MTDADTGKRHDTLARSLSSRHIQFIAIGGAIGAGLFLGSGRAIQLAGPAAILAYVISGIVIYIMARALGELILDRPDATSFVDHIESHVSRWAGFVTGWSYWLLWVLMGMVEITAIGVLLRFWFPALPQWIPALVTLAGLYTLNRAAVRLFGEAEFWLTLVKVAAITALIIVGAIMAAYRLGPIGQEATFAHLWNHGGFFPKGWGGLSSTMTIALFAFGATEMIGITAGEVADPQHAVPKAINAVIVRIMIFYVGSLLIVMSVVPWTQFDASRSPFVLVFERVGIGWAATAVNIVVISAVLSSCNSGIFATGRMLFSLAQAGDAPDVFRRLDKRRLPVAAINAGALVMAVGVMLNYCFPEQVFAYLLSVVAALLIWTWSLILIAHMRFRRTQRRAGQGPGSFRLWLSPWSNILALVTFMAVVVLMGIDSESRPTLITATGWFAFILIAYRVSRRRRSSIPLSATMPSR